MTRSLFAFIILASAALAADAPPAFETASIRPAEDSGRSGRQVVPGSVTMRGAPLGVVVKWAFDLNDAELSCPGWMNEVRFDIVAKAAGPAKEPELRAMTQTLLADRFKMAFHRETREVSALILTVGKSGHKLKEVQEEGSPSFQTGKLNLTGKGATVAQLIRFLSSQLRQPIVDQTGLAGRYDYFMDINQYVTEEMRNQPGGGPPPEAPTIIAQALQSQLGLRVDPKKAPIQVLVIDKIERTPTEN